MMAKESNQLRMVAHEDGAAVLDIRRGVISTFNCTGAYVWQELERGQAPDTIAADLALTTGEPLDGLLKDVLSFIDDLRAKHLLPS
jgi:hypothetical protein